MPNPTNSWQDYQNQMNGTGNTARDVGQAFLAPGISWIADATGNSQTVNNATDFAGLWKNSVENKDMTQEVYNSMTPAEWDAFQKMDGGGQSSFIQSRKQQISSQQPALDAQNKMKAQLQAFADEMNMPVDQLLKNDAFAQALNKSTYGNAMSNAAGRGLGPGGISTANADLTSKQALLGYQMQRQQQGLGALSQINDINNSQQGFQLTNTALNNQSANNYLAGQAANQQKMESGLMAMFGGGAGALGGMAAGQMRQGQNYNSGGMSAPPPNYGYPSTSYGSTYSGGGPSYGTYGTPSGGMSGAGYNPPATMQYGNSGSKGVSGSDYSSGGSGQGGAGEGGNY